jgi:hypothetical protein
MSTQRILLLFAFTACTSSPLPNARFANANPVSVVDDRRDVPKPPARRVYGETLYHFDGSFRQPVLRPFALPPARRAAGVNALDEVPDSTWFTNRIGVRALSADEIRTGPTTIESPEAHAPWTILTSKSEGRSLGFHIVDARGERFLIKFDEKGIPELETAAHVITGRLLWACGYNVTEDFIVHIHPADLEIATTATWRDANGTTRRLDRDSLRTLLAGVQFDRDGKVRVMASRILPGKLLGGHPDDGVRPDDPNDRIPHELRRDLRGARAVFAWLDHVDVKESNTVDVWETDPADSGRHFVRHYFVDFGKSLGAMAMIARDETRSYEYTVDYSEMFGSLVSLGLRPHKWDDRVAPSIIGVGLFERDLDPSKWKPSTPAYRPFLEADRIDWLWGAKLVMRFTPAQLRAAVEVGELSDPRAVEYLIGALVARQRAVAKYAFSRVRPLDSFTIERDAELCFDDLVIVHQLDTPAKPMRYVVTSFDRRGRRIAANAVTATPAGRVCTMPLPLSHSTDQYTIWRITATGSPGGTFVHVARNPTTSEVRVIGLWRE